MADLTIINGRYEILGPIGAGGMGTLYRARDPWIGNRVVAIKLLKEGLDNDELRRRFKQEANAAGVLEHENIVRVFDVGEHAGAPFIAMEYIDGETLAALIRRSEPLSLVRKLQIMEELCDGLAYAHSFSIVHRDIKPANLMIERRRGRLKILDFGIAKVADSGMTSAGSLIGSFNYMSPEQMCGSASLDHRSDIFSVGSVFYELLSYRQAFPGTLHDGIMGRIVEQPPLSLRQLCPTLDLDIERIVYRALEKSSHRRYPNLGAMLEDIRRRRIALERGAEADETVVPAQEVDTIPSRPPTSPSPPQAGPATPTPVARMRGADPSRLAQRRRAQIEAHLQAARAALAEGRLEAAMDSCEQASSIDQDDAEALELHERIRREIDRRQFDAWLDEARGHLDRGELTAADQVLERVETLQLDPGGVQELRGQIGDRRQRLAAARLIARGREQVAAADLDAAAATLKEAESVAPAGMLELVEFRRTVDAAREARRQEQAHRQAAEQVMSDARRLFAAGEHSQALDRLKRFVPPHLAVTALAESLEAEAAEIARHREAARRQTALEQALTQATRALEREDLDGADAALARAREAVPDSPALLELQDRVSAARAAAEQLVRRRAEAARIVSEIESSLRDGRLQQARTLLARASQIGPDSDTLSRLREQLDIAERAEAEKRAVAEADRQASEAVAAARRLFTKGEVEAALDALRSYRPAHPDVDAAIEDLVSEAERLAAEAAQRERETVEHRAQSTVNRATQQFFKGQRQDAIAALERFRPDNHPVIAAALERLRTEVVRLEHEQRLDAERRRLEATEARVAGAIAQARDRFTRGERAAALGELAAFDLAARDDVQAVLRELRDEAVRLDEEEEQARQRAEEEQHRKRIADLLQEARREFHRGHRGQAVQLLEQSAIATEPEVVWLRDELLRETERIDQQERERAERERLARIEQAADQAIEQSRRRFHAGQRHEALEDLRQAANAAHPRVQQALRELTDEAGRLDEEDRLAEIRRQEELARRRQAELDAKAAQVVARARKQFERGRRDAALKTLSTGELASHPEVVAVRVDIRNSPLPPPLPPPWWRSRSIVTGAAAAGLLLMILAVSVTHFRSESDAVKDGTFTNRRGDIELPAAIQPQLPSEGAQLSDLHEAAGRAWSSGQYEDALRLIESGLNLTPDDDELSKLLDRMLDRATSEAVAAKSSAKVVFADPMKAFREGEDFLTKAQTGSRQDRVRNLWQAAKRFKDADRAAAELEAIYGRGNAAIGKGDYLRAVTEAEKGLKFYAVGEQSLSRETPIGMLLDELDNRATSRATTARAEAAKARASAVPAFSQGERLMATAQKLSRPSKIRSLIRATASFEEARKIAESVQPKPPPVSSAPSAAGGDVSTSPTTPGTSARPSSTGSGTDPASTTPRDPSEPVTYMTEREAAELKTTVQSVQRVLEEYKQAYESMDIRALTAIRPSQQEAAQRQFALLESVTMKISDVGIRLSPRHDVATVTCRIEYRYKWKRPGFPDTGGGTTTLTLRRLNPNGSWVIQ